MKPKFGRFGLLASSIVTVTLALSGIASAASGTWNADANNNWATATTAPWLGGTVADGADNTASFTFDITAARTVTMTESRTIGNLTFDDAGATADSNWTILRGSATPVLTLQTSSGTPTITVTNTASLGSATNSFNIAGTQGFIKAGPGTLVLSDSNANTYGGITTVSQGTLQLGASGVFGKVGSASTEIALAAGTTLAHSQGAGVTQLISGAGNVIAGGFGFVAGTTFSNANTYTGTTTVVENTLTVSTLANGGVASGVGMSSSAASNLILSSNSTRIGTLIYNGAAPASTDRLMQIGTTAAGGSGTISNNAAVANTVAFTATGSVAYGTTDQTRVLGLAGSNTGLNVFAPAIGDNGTGAVSLTKSGAGTWVLTNTESFSGGTTISGGTLQLDYNSNDTSKLSNTGVLTLAGGTLALVGGSHLEQVGSTTLNIGTSNTILRPSGGATLSLGAITRGAGATLNLGVGAVVTTTNLPVSGNLGSWLTVGGGSLAKVDGLSNIIAVTYTDVPTVTGTLTDGMDQVQITGAVGSMALAAGPTINVNSLSRTAAGLATIDTAGKILRLGQQGSIFSGTGSGGFTFGTAANSGVLTAGGADNTVGSLDFNLVAGSSRVNATITDNGTAAVGVSKVGAAELTLGGTNTYSGGTTFNGGTVRVASSDSALGTGGVTFAVNSTLATQIGGGARSLANNIVLNPGITGSIDSGYFAMTLGGIISGTGNFATTSSGTTTLTGVNTYTGTTSVGASSVLQIGGSGSLGAGAYAAAITLPGGLNVATSSNQIFGGAISGAGTLTKSGTGSLTLNSAGAGSLPTNLTVNQGTVTVNGTAFAVDKMTGNGVVTINTGGVLILNIAHALGGSNSTMTEAITVNGGLMTLNSEQYFNNLTLTGATVNGAADLRASAASNLVVNGTAPSTVSCLMNLVNAGNFNVGDATLSPAADLVISGVVSNTGALNKSGAGTLSLTGVNTYTGATTVTAGTLAVNNATGSGAGTSVVTVATGGTLAGTGSFTGAATVNSGGTVAPGNAGIGTLSTGALVLPGIYACEVNAATADKIAVTGNLDVTGGTLAITAVSPSGTLVLASYTGTLTGTFGTVTGLPSGYAVNYNAPAKQIELIPATSPAYNAWVTAKLLTAGVNDGLGQDPDDDGRNNLYEFAFDGNPLSGVADGKIVSKVATVSGQQVLTLTLPVRDGTIFAGGAGEEASATAQDGVVYRIQGSADLATWTLNVNLITDPTDVAAVQGTIATTKPLGTGWTYRSFYVVGSNPTTSPKMFIRAKAQ